jgi:uncharacterized protein (DUF2252 family)
MLGLTKSTKKFIEDAVAKAIDKRLSKKVKAEEVNEFLMEETTALKRKVSTLEELLDKTKSKRLKKLKDLVSKIPDGASGVGSALIYKDGEYEEVDLKTKKQIVELIEQAENNELEIVFA